jgi:hypothetical protein
MQQALSRYYGNATNLLLHNRNCYVTMEMQYGAYIDHVTKEKPNMSQYYNIT